MLLPVLLLVTSSSDITSMDYACASSSNSTSTIVLVILLVLVLVRVPELGVTDTTLPGLVPVPMLLLLLVLTRVLVPNKL